MVANEWKDEIDKVMPVKQWLEERRLLQVYIYISVTENYDLFVCIPPSFFGSL